MSIGPANKFGLIIPKASYITSLVRQGTISKEAAKRLRWMDHYKRYRNARLTCRYYGISPQTFYRWKNRYDPYDLRTLESASHRPYKVRQPETPVKVIERIQKLREQYPRWGRDKLAVLLMKEGIEISASTVGRVINRLKARGLVREPENVRLAKLARRRRRKPRYAVRMPKGYSIEAPGDLVQMDTLKLQLISGDVRYHFSARDVVSRWDCARAFRRQTSFAAARFLEYLETKFPFKIKAIQVDGGSEFMKDFEEAIQERQILLFLIPPRSPKLNCYVERANRMHREEFYEVETIGHTMEEHNRQLERWEYIYNYVRPHQSLDYLTPAEYHELWLQTKRPERH
jgi:transposase InsO family protein